MKTERVITVRMAPNLHRALKELSHSLRAESVNKMCVRFLTDAVMADPSAREIFLKFPEEPVNLPPETSSITPEPLEKDDSRDF